MKSTSGKAGQILIPGLSIVMVLVLLLFGMVSWGSRMLWQMRMDLAADAAALSAARAEAAMLNNISTTNLLINNYIKKGDVPFLDQAIGIMNIEDLPNYENWHHVMGKMVWGFRTFPAGVGEVVSRLNGAKGYALYFPFPMDPYLVPVNVWVGLIVKFIPIPTYQEGAYYARGWSPSKLKAQPPHKTTWLVSHNGTRSIASARLWLDVPSESLLSNGGFPRVHENWVRGLGIQGFYPQFNARLLPKPLISPEQLIRLRGRI